MESNEGARFLGLVKDLEYRTYESKSLLDRSGIKTDSNHTDEITDNLELTSIAENLAHFRP